MNSGGRWQVRHQCGEVCGEEIRRDVRRRVSERQMVNCGGWTAAGDRQRWQRRAVAGEMVVGGSAGRCAAKRGERVLQGGEQYLLVSNDARCRRVSDGNGCAVAADKQRSRMSSGG